MLVKCNKTCFSHRVHDTCQLSHGSGAPVQKVIDCSVGADQAVAWIGFSDHSITHCTLQLKKVYGAACSLALLLYTNF